MAIDAPTPHQPRNRAERRAAARRSRRKGVAVAGGASLLAGGLTFAGTTWAAAESHCDFTVTDGGDGAQGDFSGETGVPNLRNAVFAADQTVDADTICFDGLAAIEISAGTIAVNNPLTIEGPGSAALTISSDATTTNGSERLFYLSDAGDVTISGTTITGFDASEERVYPYYTWTYHGDGGAIRADDTNLTLDDVTLTSNSGGDGGALSFDEDVSYYSSATVDLTITDSTFSGNTARGDGGAIAVGNAHNVTITGSTIEDNDAVYGGDGGGLYLDVGDDAVVTISDTVVTGNEAYDDGGGVFIETGDRATVTITDTELTYNVNDGAGGGLDLYVGDDSVVDITRATISGNEAYGYGGGAHIEVYDGSTLSVTDSVISGNTSTDSHGGGLAIDADEYTTVDIGDTEITGNHADDDGGGVHLGDVYGAVTVSDSTITGNTADGEGGGVWAELYENASMTIARSVVDDNTAYYGGGVHAEVNDYSTLEIADTSISGNTAEDGRGGGLYLRVYDDAAVTIVDSTIDGNTSYYSGGGIYANIDSAASVALTIEGSTISNNTVLYGDYDGGGLALDSYPGSSVVISGSTISGNSAPGDGGGIFAGDRGEVSIEHSTITGNTAGGHGGGILAESRTMGGWYYHTDVSLDHTIVFGNSSSYEGEDDLALVDHLGLGAEEPTAPATITATWSLIGDAGETGIADGTDGNIVGDDPLLGALADNGGSTLTHLPGSSSPAVDAGDPEFTSSDTDQRGEDRVVNDRVDMGSVEVQPPPPTTTTAPPVTAPPPTTTPPTTTPPTTPPTTTPPPPRPPVVQSPIGGSSGPVFMVDGEAVQVPLPPGVPTGQAFASVAVSPTESIVVTADGQVFTTNPDHNLGDIPQNTRARLRAKVVGLGLHFTREGASSSSLRAAAVGDWVPSGYWLLGADGGVFSFGTARFYGSTGAMDLNRPVVAMTPTSSGHGYWLVASDGGVFSFGDARFYGSTGAMKLNQPIVSMVPTASGKGYYLVAADGGVFTFGDARFHGSGADTGRSFTGAILTASGDGYWLLEPDGTRHPFGDAR